MTRYTALYAFAMFLGLGACSSRISDSDQFLIFAQEVYFGGPNDNHIDIKRELIRWSRPLRVSLAAPQTERYRDQVAGHLADFERLTGLTASFAETPDEVNLTIAMSGGDTYKLNGEVSRCVINIQSENGDIEFVNIRIGATAAAKIEHCLAHELYHAFGLHFHSVAAASVLSSVHNETSPTAADNLALSMLYDSRLYPGAAPDEAAAILREMTSKVTGDFGKHWIAVLPSESRIQVQYRAISNYVSRYVRSWDPDQNLTLEVVFWVGSVVPDPVAIIALLTSGRGYFIDNLPTFRDHISKLVKFNKKPVQFGEKKKHKGRYGLVDTVELQIDDRSCLGFRQRLGSTLGTGGTTDVLVGYYCADPGASMDMNFASEFLESVQISGV